MFSYFIPFILSFVSCRLKVLLRTRGCRVSTFTWRTFLSLFERTNYQFWQSANTLGFLSRIISYLCVRLLRSILFQKDSTIHNLFIALKVLYVAFKLNWTIFLVIIYCLSHPCIILRVFTVYLQVFT